MSPSHPSRITLKDIAKAAEVSVMTVSYALRNSPEISRQQCERVQKIAQKLGYRPDPVLAHLMAHLRGVRGPPKTTINLAVLTMYEPGFVQRLVGGATARADQLGYTLDRIDLSRFKAFNNLTRTLRARGVAGLILAPTRTPGMYRKLLDWSRFASTAMTYSLTDLPINRVVAHHFENARRTFALLHERGFQRIGLAMTADMEFRANHSYSGAYFRLTPIDGLKTFPPLLLDYSNRANIPQWFENHRPDAVVLSNANHFSEFILPHAPRSLVRKTFFATLDRGPTDIIAGIDQGFETIGAKAVDDVVNQLLRGERGLHLSPTVTMLEGQWIEAGVHTLPLSS